MKKLFLTSVILCVLGWLCFNISLGIVGYKYHDSSFTYVNSGNSAARKDMVFGGDYDSSAAWSIVNEFPNININSAGVNTIVTRGESNMIKVRLSNPNGKKVHVEAVYDKNSLTIEARSTNITFVSGGSFGLVNWLEDIFTGSTSGAVVIIEFPESKYDSLNIQQGSGSMKVHDLYADRNNIHIGSGSFEFLRRSESFVSERFDIELGSGKAVLSGVQTESYNINIGSGSFDISGLSGDGYIDMGSGSGNIAFKKYNGPCLLDMGSGNIKLFVPEDSGITIDADIGSGRVTIDACDVKAEITSHNDDELFYLGDPQYALTIDMGSGHVSILDLANYAAPAIEDIVIGSYVDIVDVGEFSFSETSSIQSTIIGSSNSGSFGTASEVEQSTSLSPTEPYSPTVESSSVNEPTEVPDDNNTEQL